MTVLALTDPAPRAQDHASARRRGRAVCAPKHAFAPRGFCRDSRRPVLPRKPQVGSGVRPGSHRRIVGVSCFYDPAPGQFVSRDPLTPLTRSAYGYAGNNPLNASDPSGLFGFSDIKRMASDAVGFVEDHTGDAVSAVGAVGRVVLNNAPIGGFGPSVNELGMMLAGPGANCHGLPGLHAECDNSLVHLDGDAPFTVGDVVLNTKGGPITDRDLLEHEMNHSNQWAAFGGWPFLPAYMFDRFVVHDGNGACSWFEQAADARKGGYGACGC